MGLEFTNSENLMLNDSEIQLLAEGPIRWAQGKAGQRLNVDQFVRDLQEQINKCGFTCQVKVYDTDEAEVYAFEVELNGRTGLRVFDPDQMVYEVTHNVLNLKGEQSGFVKTKDAAQRLLQREGPKKGKKHRH